MCRNKETEAKKAIGPLWRRLAKVDRRLHNKVDDQHLPALRVHVDGMTAMRTPSSFSRVLRPDGPAALGIVRVVVGLVFLSEGIQKFLFPADVGTGRFAKIGIPAPEILAPFVGTLEIIGGAALVVGLLSRLFAVPLLFNMLVAITSTKLVTMGKNGFWKTAHEARTDVLMISGLLLILALGPGRRSLDARLDRKRP